MSDVLSFAQLPPDATRTIEFAGYEGGIEITTYHEPFDITDTLRDPEDFHGSKEVHALVNFKGAMAGLIGDFEDNPLLPTDPKDQVAMGVLILSNHGNDTAKRIVATLNGFANELQANPALYDDTKFCKQYYDATKAGYDLLNQEVPGYLQLPKDRISVSLERAGLVTTRLALGESSDAVLANEIKVVTKRAHPKDGIPSDLMVSVKWRDFDSLSKLHGANVEIADFVNPASWASTAAFILALAQRGIKPERLIHNSIMATEQGTAFAANVLRDIGIEPVFISVGSSNKLSKQYYLQDPGVGDAGHVLRHFLPVWYKA
ncbi:MAG: hypothetical protein Q7T41_02335 [Candidatus Saccharibacteria bacterium]|nr:hypothetical protein [Candidatus Saccharibacteria bacterium]